MPILWEDPHDSPLGMFVTILEAIRADAHRLACMNEDGLADRLPLNIEPLFGILKIYSHIHRQSLMERAERRQFRAASLAEEWTVHKRTSAQNGEDAPRKWRNLRTHVWSLTNPDTDAERQPGKILAPRDGSPQSSRSLGQGRRRCPYVVTDSNRSAIPGSGRRWQNFSRR
jgi:hypothetical protein